MKKIVQAFVYSFISLFIYFFILPSLAWASGEFQADYDVQYAISPVGKTIVTQHVTLTNKLPDFYPQEYTLLLDSDKINNVIAYDDGGIITPTISVKDGKTQISLTFNVKAIGLGKSFTFSLRYEHSGIASKAGNIWEIYVPGVVNDADIGAYDVTLAVPPTFGPAAYLSPRPQKGNTWTKEQMIRGGIAGAYGNSQKFDVTLSYLLTNSGSGTQTQIIALPPDTAYQEVVINSLEPQPTTVTRDDDGNWLAHYQLSGGQTISVRANASISIYLSPRKGFVTKPVTISDYIGPQKYWETEDPAIAALARQYRTPREIYEYAATALSYDYEKINEQATRLGAINSLKTPKEAVCMEFTDLFIAISRAAGIPARRNVGYAYTNNPKLRPLSLVSDILHAWPEYYDQEQGIWIPIDPTWANTTGGVDYFAKLDFNHIVFAINGKDSVLPYPAGYYKDPGKNSRDVSVEFSKSETKGKGAEVATFIEFPETIGAGTTAKGAIVVSNRGGESAYNISVSAVSEPGGVHIIQTIGELLPYAVERIPFSAKFDAVTSNVNGKITVQVNDTLVTKAFTIQPLYWLIVLGIITLVLSVVVALKFVRIVLWKTSKKH